MTNTNSRNERSYETDLLAEVLGYETHEVARQASGINVHTNSGQHFCDFTGGIAVHACGHNHPSVVRAIRDQSKYLLHISDVMKHEPQLALAARLRAIFTEVLPGEPWQFLLLNSGSESIDAAAKLAMRVTGRYEFAAFEGAFHGRTLMATALSYSKPVHWKAYEPLVAALRKSISHLPSPRIARVDESRSVDSCLEAMKALFSERGDRLAAIFFEGQQGEGGYFPMHPAVAAELQQLARKHGVLLVADEIQAGCGRTGRWFSFEHLQIQPDIVTFGKALGGGLPLAGLGAARSLLEKWAPGEHGTTFGGNPLACAAGLAALAVIEKQSLIENAAKMGAMAKSLLEPLIGEYGVADIRGNGLMLAMELRDSAGNPDYERCLEVKKAAQRVGLLVLTCGASIGHPETDCAAIRIIPPLNVTSSELIDGLNTLMESLYWANYYRNAGYPF